MDIIFLSADLTDVYSLNRVPFGQKSYKSIQIYQIIIISALEFNPWLLLVLSVIQSVKSVRPFEYSLLALIYHVSSV